MTADARSSPSHIEFEFKMTAPKVTVLMPVYNGEKYLRPAIDSILRQSHKDFEFLLIDDGSTDASPDICGSYRDSRIRLVSNQRNLGLIATLNRGLELAGGEYVARMDCDDVSLPQRLERQVDFMDRNPEVGISGTWFEKLSGRKREIVRPPFDDPTIRFFLVFDNIFLHSSMFLRRAFLNTHGLRYHPDYKYTEDFELWVRCADHTRLANLPEVLVRYRYHPENTCNRFGTEQAFAADGVRRRQLQSLGMELAPGEAELHNALMGFKPIGELGDLERAKIWLERLVELGSGKCGVAAETSSRFLSRFWYGACGKRADLGWRLARLFFSSPVGRAAQWEWKWKILLRCAAERPIVESWPETGP